MISKTKLALLLGMLMASGIGCHELQRHRLDRWNRVPDSMPTDDYNFSIPDPPLPRMEAKSVTPVATCTSNVCAE
jgi:hypothetical protein